MGLRYGDKDFHSRRTVQKVEVLNDVLVADESFRLYFCRLVYRSKSDSDCRGGMCRKECTLRCVLANNAPLAYSKPKVCRGRIGRYNRTSWHPQC